jgi:zinc protease
MSRVPTPIEVTLPNGLVVLVLRRDHAPIVATTLLYGAGSLHEPDGHTGLAHLMEHMMFRGTPAYPQGEIDSLTGRLGGVNNAVTTTDYAAYYFVLPSEHWRVPLEIEADRMAACPIDVESFETERRVALEERKMFQDDPEAMLDETVDRLALERHPYRHPVVGLREDIERMTFGDLRAFYESHYVPNNAVLAVAGDIDEDQVVAEAGRLFGTIEAGALAPIPSHAEPPQTSPRHAEIQHGAAPPQAVLAYHTPSATHDDAPAVELLATLLGVGRTCRLYKRFVAGDGVASEISATRLFQKEPGLFYIAGTLHPGADLEQFEGDVMRVLEELAREPVPRDELAKATEQIRTDHELGRETCLGLAGALAFWETLGGWQLEREFETGLANVTGEDVARVVETYFAPDTRSVAWLTPVDE